MRAIQFSKQAVLRLSVLLAFGVALSACSHSAPNWQNEVVIDEPFYKRNDSVERLLVQAKTFERADRFASANQIYAEIIKDYPNAMFQDQNKRFNYASFATEQISLNKCRRLRALFSYTGKLEVLQQKVKEMLQYSRIAELQKHASCNFGLRLRDSDAAWLQGKDEYALEVVVDLFKKLSAIKKVSRNKCERRQTEAVCFNDLYGFSFIQRKWGWLLHSFSADSRYLLPKIKKLQELRKLKIAGREPSIRRVRYGTEITMPKRLLQRVRSLDQQARFLESDDYRATDRWFMQLSAKEAMHTVVGDFNGDKVRDAAFLMQSGKQLVTRVALSAEVGYKIVELGQFSRRFTKNVQVALNFVSANAYGSEIERVPVKNRFDAFIWRNFNGKAWFVYFDKQLKWHQMLD